MTLGVMGVCAQADPVPCDDPRFAVEGGGDAHAAICDAAQTAATQLSSCELEITEPVVISLVDRFEVECLALFHCDERRVEIMHPDAYADLLAEGRGGAFAPLSPDAFFQSLMRHELVHAALTDMPCPFESCLVGQEYIAYTLQVRFLPDVDRAAFEAVDPHDGPVSRDVLNPIILMMAPDVFARRAWQHLTERPNACAFIGQIARAEVLLDYEHP